MSGLKTTVRITVTSPLRGVFDRAFDVTARPRDVEEREARSALPDATAFRSYLAAHGRLAEEVRDGD